MAKDTYRYYGRDPSGYARVWGDGPTPDVAETECCKAVREYVARRPDMGPVANWTVEKAVPSE
jgi:hypothetical protein